MIETLASWQFWVIFIPLILVIWIKMRIVERESYGLGARHGFALGVCQTVQTLTNERMISEDRLEKANFDSDKVLDEVMPLITANLLKEANRKVLS